MADKKQDIPWGRYAFHNVYNYATMSGFVGAALISQHWWIGLLGMGTEAIWMLFAPDSLLLQTRWFKAMHAAEVDKQQWEAWRRKLSQLPEGRQIQIIELQRLQQRIMQMAHENQAVSGVLLEDELTKLEQIVRSYGDLVELSYRLENYIASADFNNLEADLRRARALVEKPRDLEQRDVAQKNLAVLTRRLDKLKEIRSSIDRSRAQMELIENTLALMSDQVVTMQSPRELSRQLDDLVDGVEAVRSTVRETDALLEHA